MSLRKLDVELAQLFLRAKSCRKQQLIELLPNRREGPWRTMREVREQQVLHVEAGGHLRREMAGAYAGLILAKADQFLRNALDRMRQGHPPPQVCVLIMEADPIAAQRECLLYIERDGGMADRKQVAVADDRAQLFGRSPRTAE